MSAQEKPAPLTWWTDTLAGVQWTALNGLEVRVHDSRASKGPWARPWHVALFRDDCSVGYVGRCKNEDTAKRSAEKRLREAAK